VLSLILCALQPVSAKNQTEDERLFTAAFIYNFAKFTRWPDLSQQNQTLTLCTQGNDELVSDLKRLSGKIIKGRRLTVQQFNNKKRKLPCQLLYIASSEKKHVKNILNAVQNKPVLTISILPKFAKSGGMVQLYTQKGQTRFIINLGKVRDVNLEISSRLLILAKVVGNEKTP